MSKSRLSQMLSQSEIPVLKKSTTFGSTNSQAVTHQRFAGQLARVDGKTRAQRTIHHIAGRPKNRVHTTLMKILEFNNVQKLPIFVRIHTALGDLKINQTQKILSFFKPFNKIFSNFIKISSKFSRYRNFPHYLSLILIKLRAKRCVVENARFQLTKSLGQKKL